MWCRNIVVTQFPSPFLGFSTRRQAAYIYTAQDLNLQRTLKPVLKAPGLCAWS
jgi:hypothetical protein